MISSIVNLGKSFGILLKFLIYTVFLKKKILVMFLSYIKFKDEQSTKVLLPEKLIIFFTTF